jgi:hypothetical protein
LLTVLELPRPKLCKPQAGIRFAEDRLTEYHAGRCLDITARRMFELRLP